jgi:hypothetical protein
MQYALCLLTATWMAGQVAQAPTDAPAPIPAPAVRQITPAAPTDAPAPAPTLRDRLRKLFGVRQAEHSSPAPSGTVVVKDYPTGQPLGQPQGPPREPAPLTTTVTTPRPSSEPAAPATDLDKTGHEKDYSWITGRLTRDGGRWVIRYGAPNEVDHYNGRLPLAGNADLSKLHEGDLVCVHGQVATGSRGLLGAAGSVYQVRDVNVIEPARP